MTSAAKPCESAIAGVEASYGRSCPKTLMFLKKFLKMCTDKQ